MAHKFAHATVALPGMGKTLRFVNFVNTIYRAFEAIVYLKENIDYWDISLIQQMVAGKWDERLKEDYNSESDEEDDP